jgi:predicted RNA polymerase sigma factor
MAEAVLLEDQDRRLWDRSAVRRGLAALDRASSVGRGLGPYGLQAAIAACHASASSVAETDWERVVLLYEALGRVAPSPVVELNRAVAIAMAAGPQPALSMVDELGADCAATAANGQCCCARPLRWRDVVHQLVRDANVVRDELFTDAQEALRG